MREGVPICFGYFGGLGGGRCLFDGGGEVVPAGHGLDAVRAKGRVENYEPVLGGVDWLGGVGEGETGGGGEVLFGEVDDGGVDEELARGEEDEGEEEKSEFR